MQQQFSCSKLYQHHRQRLTRRDTGLSRMTHPLSFFLKLTQFQLIPYHRLQATSEIPAPDIEGSSVGAGHNLESSSIFSTQSRTNSFSSNKKQNKPLCISWVQDTVLTSLNERKDATNPGQTVVRNGMWVCIGGSVPGNTPNNRITVASSHQISTCAALLVSSCTAFGSATTSSGAPTRHSSLNLTRQALASFVPERDVRKDRRMRNGLIGGLVGAGTLLM